MLIRPLKCRNDLTLVQGHDSQKRIISLQIGRILQAWWYWEDAYPALASAYHQFSQALTQVRPSILSLCSHTYAMLDSIQTWSSISWFSKLSKQSVQTSKCRLRSSICHIILWLLSCLPVWRAPYLARLLISAVILRLVISAMWLSKQKISSSPTASPSAASPASGSTWNSSQREVGNCKPLQRNAARTEMPESYMQLYTMTSSCLPAAPTRSGRLGLVLGWSRSTSSVSKFSVSGSM